MHYGTLGRSFSSSCYRRFIVTCSLAFFFLFNSGCYLNTNISGLLNSESLKNSDVVPSPESSPRLPSFKTMSLPTQVPEGYPYNGVVSMENVTGSIVYSLEANTCEGLEIDPSTGVTSGLLNHYNMQSCSYKIKAVNNGTQYTSDAITLNFEAPLTFTFSSSKAQLQKGSNTNLQLTITPTPPYDAVINYSLTSSSGVVGTFLTDIAASGTIDILSGQSTKTLNLDLPSAASFTGVQYQSLKIQTGNFSAKPSVDLTLYETPAPTFEKVSMSLNHACGISSGKLYCWGKNDNSKLGLGAVSEDKLTPQRVGVLTNWQEISAGDTHTCGIESGKLFCWGNATQAQIGGATARTVPTQIGALTTWQKVDAGTAHTCAIAAGRLYCTGSNSYRQVGDGSTNSLIMSFTAIGALTTWQEISAGYRHTCGIAGGSLYCWGSDSFGAVGNGSASGTSVIAPEKIGLLTTWQKVSTGQNHSCGIESGNLYCWGSDSQSQIGDGPVSAMVHAPKLIGTLTDWEGIAAADHHTCGIESGKLYCWGANGYGQLGAGFEIPIEPGYGTAYLNTPTQVGSSDQWQSISAYGFQSCGLESGKINCWGMNDNGQLGIGISNSPSLVPKLTGPQTWQKFSMAGTNACGIIQGELYCWGTNHSNNVGFETLALKVVTPTKIGALKNWQHVSIGNQNACGIESGKLYCWGSNSNYALGLGSDSTLVKKHPFQIGTLTNWQYISAGLYHVCGIESGKLYCWGSDSYGKLGNAADGVYFVPTQIGSLSNWQHIDGGDDHTCGIESGKLYCWGKDSDGQVGNSSATSTDVESPVQIGSLTNWKKVSTGGMTTCGIESGNLYCWGADGYGNTGNGATTGAVHDPSQISSSGLWTDVYIGYYHGCGIEGGKLYCWGKNASGEAGIGSVTTSLGLTSPNQAGTMTNWTLVFVGSDSTCGIESGKLYCQGAPRASFSAHDTSRPVPLIEF